MAYDDETEVDTLEIPDEDELDEKETEDDIPEGFHEVDPLTAKGIVEEEEESF